MQHKPPLGKSIPMTFVLELLGIALGAIIVIKTEWFVQNFGTSEWAEAHMGTSGGTRLLYKLIGVGIIVIAMLAMAGLLGGLIMGTVGKLFGGVQAPQ